MFQKKKNFDSAFINVEVLKLVTFGTKVSEQAFYMQMVG